VSGAREGLFDGGEVLAALDLGTNNCRLLIARPAPGDFYSLAFQAASLGSTASAGLAPQSVAPNETTGGANPGFQVIDAFSRVVRLGEGVAQAGQLSGVAMERTIEALRICAAKMRRRGVTLARAVATEACRRAENGAPFIERVARETGIALEIITSGEEARLAFQGCLPLLDPAQPHAIVFDIGGGSTELGWIRLRPHRAPEIVAWHSVPLGVVSLTEEFGVEARSGQSPLDYYETMRAKVAAALAPFAQAIGAEALIRAGQVQMLGTSGTVTTLSGIHMGLLRYDRALVDGSYLAFADVERIIGNLAQQDCSARATVPCIGVERAELVVAGCAILDAIIRRWPVGRLRVADRGVREGILVSFLTGLLRDSRGGRFMADRRMAEMGR